MPHLCGGGSLGPLAKTLLLRWFDTGERGMGSISSGIRYDERVDNNTCHISAHVDVVLPWNSSLFAFLCAMTHDKHSNQVDMWLCW